LLKRSSGCAGAGDDASRLAYAEVLANERSPTAVAFFEVAVHLVETPDFSEGLRIFFEKRPAKWE
jgi:hypothetical protein